MIARNYEDTRKVEDLLNKLNSYLKSGNLDDVDNKTTLSLPNILPSTNVDTNSVIETNYNAVIPETEEEDDEGNLAPPPKAKPKSMARSRSP